MPKASLQLFAEVGWEEMEEMEEYHGIPWDIRFCGHDHMKQIICSLILSQPSKSNGSGNTLIVHRVPGDPINSHQADCHWVRRLVQQWTGP